MVDKPGPEPEIGGVLGRAMERARRSGGRPDEGRPRDEFPGTAADLLTTPVGAAGLALFAVGAASLVFFLRDRWYPMVLALGGLVIVFWGAAQAAQWFLGPRLGVAVGADGVLVRGRFIPYSRILSVEHACHREHDADTGRTFLLWIVALEMVGGERVVLRTGTSEGTRNAAVADLAHAVEEARSAWIAGTRGAGAGSDILSGGERSPAEWVRALRGAGSASGGVYRAVNADVEEMSRLLDDSRAAPSARAAAAIALGACGDGTAARRLRLAAGAMANPRLRVALERIAEGGDDGEIAEALEEVLEADRGAR